MPGNQLVFVYGTLKRGSSNHGFMAGQTFRGEATTQPGFCLIDLGDYPGLISDPEDTSGVIGEVWDVDAACLARLDALEGVADGLYRRDRATLRPPFRAQPIDTYFYALPFTGLAKIPGGNWTE